VSPAKTWATALRVLRQLRRDPRTIALILLVPALLVTILHYVFEGRPAVFDRVGGPMLGLFPFVSMFVVTSVTMLRERVTGTLERLMTTPLAKLDLLLGYAIAFAALAAVQAAFVSGIAIFALDLDLEGSTGAVVGLAIANALLGMSLGLFSSAFARTEFQAVQFLPALVLPQILLCGLFVPRDQMAGWLGGISAALPLTYSYDALARVTGGEPLTDRFALDVGVTVGVTLLALALGAATLRRRTA
jgi:ABC-2 type transport system permease protein